jgi:hypothetical protein
MSWFKLKNAILKMNPQITDPNIITAGQILRLPAISKDPARNNHAIRPNGASHFPTRDSGKTGRNQ